MVAVVPEYEKEFMQLAKGLGMELQSFGTLVEKGDTLITVV